MDMEKKPDYKPAIWPPPTEAGDNKFEQLAWNQQIDHGAKCVWTWHSSEPNNNNRCHRMVSWIKLKIKNTQHFKKMQPFEIIRNLFKKQAQTLKKVRNPTLSKLWQFTQPSSISFLAN
jgi:hypothetical protein